MLEANLSISITILTAYICYMSTIGVCIFNLLCSFFTCRICTGANFTVAGGGSGEIVLTGIQCTGNETSILDCDTSMSSNCTHDQDVGVTCAPG